MIPFPGCQSYLEKFSTIGKRTTNSNHLENSQSSKQKQSFGTIDRGPLRCLQTSDLRDLNTMLSCQMDSDLHQSKLKSLL